MYWAILKYHGQATGRRLFLGCSGTPSAALHAVADIMERNNNTEQTKRAPFGNWLCCVFVYDTTGAVVGIVEQQPWQAMHSVLNTGQPETPTVKKPTDPHSQKVCNPSNQKTAADGINNGQSKNENL